jgi:hypothetical protein
MTSVVGALLAAAVLSLLFAGTRLFGIACIVILCFLNPLLAACLVVLAITLVLFILK